MYIVIQTETHREQSKKKCIQWYICNRSIEKVYVYCVAFAINSMNRYKIYVFFPSSFIYNTKCYKFLCEHNKLLPLTQCLFFSRTNGFTIFSVHPFYFPMHFSNRVYAVWRIRIIYYATMQTMVLEKKCNKSVFFVI